MIWREPKDHVADCYFCSVNTTGFSVKNKHKIVYPSLDSAIRPVPHDASLPIPVPPLDGLESVEDEIEFNTLAGSTDQDSADSEYTPDSDIGPETFNQDELNDLVRDLSLSKEKAELWHLGLSRNICLQQA